MTKTTASRRLPAVAFWLSLGAAAVVFVPFIIYNRGQLIFFGDFNVQQIPFYQLAHRAVRSGEIWWNWHTDLGANFIGSYSFYLLFSPFFWLTLPFPNEWVPYLMGPLLILKTACAGLTSHLYLRRFVQDERYALIGSVLYAFSGFTVVNIFFNHFHEVIVFFPLLLLALEELVQNNRRGVFALAVAANCMVNYWFFIGEVVFVLLYVAVRALSPGWQLGWRRFFAIAFESVLGLLLAMWVFLPSVLAIMGNPRVTPEDNLLTGWLCWIYGYPQRLPAILQSLFFPPELPSQPNFFPDHGAKWASLCAWLPLFSTAGTFSYLFWKKNDFLKRMLLASFVMALIPLFNAAFVLFNNSYYARWFYMPVLLMCAATIQALEHRQEAPWGRGLRWTLVCTLFFVLAVGLTPVSGEEGWSLGLMAYPARFWLYSFFALLCLALSALLLTAFGRHPAFVGRTLWVLLPVCCVYSMGFIVMGKNSPQNDRWLQQVALGGREEMAEFAGEPFARSDLYNSLDNLGMFWGLPNIQAFHSVVPASIMEFYPAIGVKRDVSSKPDVRYHALRSMLSVRWVFIPQEEDDENLMPGLSYLDSRLGYCIYENTLALPMGFGYEYSVTPDVADPLFPESLSNLMLYAVYLEEEAAERNLPAVLPLRELDTSVFSPARLEENVAARRQYACDQFAIDADGFSAHCDLPREMLMFFSVPYDKGWSATVNGEPAVIEKANIGFMAVRVPAGACDIRFVYRTPGLLPGVLISLGALAAFAVYLLACRLAGQRPRGANPAPQPLAPPPAPVQQEGPASAAAPMPAPKTPPAPKASRLGSLFKGQRRAGPPAPPAEPGRPRTLEEYLAQSPQLLEDFTAEATEEYDQEDPGSPSGRP